MPAVTVLDTTLGDTGATQTADDGFLKKNILEGGARFFAAIGAGDTVLIEGKCATADSYSTLQSITASGCYDVKLAPIWQARRSVDGGGADSTIKMLNVHAANVTADS